MEWMSGPSDGDYQGRTVGARGRRHGGARKLMQPAGQDFVAFFGKFECDFALFYLIRLRVRNVLRPHGGMRVSRPYSDACASCMDGPGNRVMVLNVVSLV